jgi:hypothetical protein
LDPRITRKRLDGMRIAVAIAMVVLLGGLAAYDMSVQATPSQTQSGAQGTWQGEQDCSFKNFNDSVNVYGQSCDTGTIVYGGVNNAGGVSGTNASAVVQAEDDVLGSGTGGSVAWLPGTYSLSHYVTIGSSTTWSCDQGVKITFKSGFTTLTLSNPTGSYGILNKVRTGAGNSNIEIRDCSIYGQAHGSPFRFDKVTNLYLTNLYYDVNGGTIGSYSPTYSYIGPLIQNSVNVHINGMTSEHSDVGFYFDGNNGFSIDNLVIKDQVDNIFETGVTSFGVPNQNGNWQVTSINPDESEGSGAVIDGNNNVSYDLNVYNQLHACVTVSAIHVGAFWYGNNNIQMSGTLSDCDQYGLNLYCGAGINCADMTFDLTVRSCGLATQTANQGAGIALAGIQVWANGGNLQGLRFSGVLDGNGANANTATNNGNFVVTQSSGGNIIDAVSTMTIIKSPSYGIDFNSAVTTTTFNFMNAGSTTLMNTLGNFYPAIATPTPSGSAYTYTNTEPFAIWVAMSNYQTVTDIQVNGQDVGNENILGPWLVLPQQTFIVTYSGAAPTFYAPYAAG